MQKFWDVIAHYNQDTWVIQIIFIFMIIFSAAILINGRINGYSK